MSPLIYSPQHDLHYLPLAEGIGEAVARRTFFRENEIWPDVASRVSTGNCLLHPSGYEDVIQLREDIAQGRVLSSGRHLQHGDVSQPLKNGLLFTNCATALTTSLMMYLALNGSGIGTCYDDELQLIDWNHAPRAIPFFSADHEDASMWHGHTRTVKGAPILIDHQTGEIHDLNTIVVHVVEDSREGWAKSVEYFETVTYYNQTHPESRIENIFLDFSEVRPKGSPIHGMQNRPASGPTPLMEAFMKVNAVVDQAKRFEAWEIKAHVDHFFAACVLFGGIRRVARATYKWWKNPGILKFIGLKKNGGLWTANNSVAVDAEFWEGVRNGDSLCNQILDAATEAAYYDGSGEPGLLNIDKLEADLTGFQPFVTGELSVGDESYQPSVDMQSIIMKLAEKVSNHQYPNGVNPCFEISLNHLLGVCLVGDIALANCTKENVFRAALLLTRMLIRANLMNSVYGDEIRRTNRIGVSFTGLHEFAWKQFGLGFRDLIDESKSQFFWSFMSSLRRRVVEEAISYSETVGLPAPHTITTVKPAGTTSKLYGLTEGMHLPAMREYLRWVQFTKEDPLVKEYEEMGYPVQWDVKGYPNTAIVGFPTQPLICQIGMGDNLVTASEATMDEQYQFLVLVEKYWIIGTDVSGNMLNDGKGNQISTTIKFRPADISYEEFRACVLEYQPKIRCAAIMPQLESTVYGYQPEQPITREAYEVMMSNINSKKNGNISVNEEIDLAHIDCSSGACPVDFKSRKM